MNNWQYRLPCGHCVSEKRASVERQGNKAYDRIAQKKLYYCKQCNSHFDYKIDKLNDTKVKA